MVIFIKFNNLGLVFTFQIEEKRGGGGVKMVWEMGYGHLKKELYFICGC